MLDINIYACDEFDVNILLRAIKAYKQVKIEAHIFYQII